MDVTNYTTAKQAGIIAFYRSKDMETIRVYDMVDDYKVEFIDGSKSRWYSTHHAMTLKNDVRMALVSFTGKHILIKDIDFDLD